MASEPPTFSSLPGDTVGTILGYLDPRDFFSCSQVDKATHEIAVNILTQFFFQMVNPLEGT